MFVRSKSFIFCMVFCSIGAEAAQQKSLNLGNQTKPPTIQGINQRAGAGGPAPTSTPTVFTMIPSSTSSSSSSSSTSAPAPTTTTGGTSIVLAVAMVSLTSSTPAVQVLTSQTAGGNGPNQPSWVSVTPADSGGPTSTFETTTTVDPSVPTTLQTSASTSDSAASVATGTNASAKHTRLPSNLPLIIGIAVPGVAALLIAALWFCFYRRNKEAKEADTRDAERNGAVELQNRTSTTKSPRTSGTGLSDRRSKTKQAPLSSNTSLFNYDEDYYPISPQEAKASPEYYSTPPTPPTPNLSAASTRSPPPKYLSPVTGLRLPPPRPPRPESLDPTLLGGSTGSRSPPPRPARHESIAQTTLGGLRERFDASSIAQSHNGAPPLSAGRTPYSVILPERELTPQLFRSYNPDPSVPDTEYERDRGHAPSNSEPYGTGYGYNRAREDDGLITPRGLNVIKRSASDNPYEFEPSVAPTTEIAPESIIDDYGENYTIPESSYGTARRNSDQGRAYDNLEGRNRRPHSPPPLLRHMAPPPSEYGSSIYTSDTYGIPYSDSQPITPDMRRRRQERLAMEEKMKREAQ